MEEENIFGLSKTRLDQQHQITSELSPPAIELCDSEHNIRVIPYSNHLTLLFVNDLYNLCD